LVLARTNPHGLPFTSIRVKSLRCKSGKLDCKNPD
jgi:hypothetical protein